MPREAFGTTLANSFQGGYRLGLAGARNKRYQEEHDWKREDREEEKADDALWDEFLQGLSANKPPANTAATSVQAPANQSAGAMPASTTPPSPTAGGAQPTSPELSTGAAPSLTPSGTEAPGGPTIGAAGGPTIGAASPTATQKPSFLAEQQETLAELHRYAQDPRYSRIADRIYKRAESLEKNINSNESIRKLRFAETQRLAAPHLRTLLTASDPNVQAQALAQMMTILPDGHQWQVAPAAGGFTLENEAGVKYDVKGDDILKTAQAAMSTPDGLASVLDTQLQADAARVVKQEDEEYAKRKEKRSDESYEWRLRKKLELEKKYGMSSGGSRSGHLQLADEMLQIGMASSRQEALAMADTMLNKGKMNPVREATSFVQALMKGSTDVEALGNSPMTNKPLTSYQQAIEHYTDFFKEQNRSFGDDVTSSFVQNIKTTIERNKAKAEGQ
jgi:polyhydroxyalkanoate synthesis regulator phasin